MLSKHMLDELIQYHPGNPVLSVYLDLDPTTGTAETYKLQYRQLAKPYFESAPNDAESVEHFLSFQYDWGGRSLAVFSCEKDGFLRSFSMAVPTRSRIRRLDRPYIKPLAALLDRYGNFGTVLVGKQIARLFHFHLGEILDSEEISGEAVRHTKSGGGSQAQGRRGGTAGFTRYSEELIDRNLREAARGAAEFFDRSQVRRVLILGTDEVIAQFQEHLPKQWQSLVISTGTIDINASPTQVMEKTHQYGIQAEAQREAQLVNSLISAAAKQEGAVIGLDETLAAAHAGNVRVLVVADGFRAPGYRCNGCGYLSSHPTVECLFCGASVEQVEDSIEIAIQQVLRDGGEVEIPESIGALAEKGRIGALLRYPISTANHLSP